MKGSIATIRDLLLLFPFVGLFLSCAGQEGTSTVAPMERKEKEALYSTIQGFVGKWWNGSDLYPDPFGRTGLQVLFFFSLRKYRLCFCCMQNESMLIYNLLMRACIGIDHICL